MKRSILIVEDESDILEMIRFRLLKEGYDVVAATNGRDAIHLAREKHPDLIILDLMLPFVSGLDVLRSLQKDQSSIPVLILSAKGEDSDVVVGLELGADDYVVKPFNMSILIARIKAKLRRCDADAAAASAVLSYGPIRIDEERFEAVLDGVPLSLTPTEFRLLKTLVEARGKVLSRNRLIEDALGEDAMSSDRTIDVHLTSLRGKMGEHRVLIETVRGIGYRMRDILYY